ncbi:MAG: hypothetical protein V7K67_06395 [Nostoc sp.]
MKKITRALRKTSQGYTWETVEIVGHTNGLFLVECKTLYEENDELHRFFVERKFLK